mmetsp:Transcript_14489/g.35398  ORF Transcript_14489/g.35398 Transcript_14489/m.35398 type:complete len:373 (-) Transcript_14489:77-1195(-)
MWTSRRPGRKIASSSMSRLLVMPIRSILFSASTPSIFVSSWFTMLSCTPVPLLVLPRALHTASISSKMMMCKSLSSPLALYSASASAKSARTFSSDCPTYLLITSGPLTIFGSLPLSILPICRAMSVLPVPGGPCRSMPLTCWMPRRCTTDLGKTREEKARRKMFSNCASRPPMPSFSKLNSLVLNRLEFTVEVFWLEILMAELCAASNTKEVAGVSRARSEVTPGCTPATSTEFTVNRKLFPQYSTAAFCPTVNTCEANVRFKMAASCTASTCSWRPAALRSAAARSLVNSSSKVMPAASNCVAGGVNGSQRSASPVLTRSNLRWTPLSATQPRSTSGCGLTKSTKSPSSAYGTKASSAALTNAALVSARS